MHYIRIIYRIFDPLKSETKEHQGKELTKENNSKNYADFDAYKEEYIRLGALKDATEDIWEDRTYQISAGGLSLTFMVFSYLMGKDNGISFSWQMAVIWGGFVFCLIVNYLSQHLSKCNFLKQQEALAKDREKDLPYNEVRLAERNKKYDRRTNILNIATELVLVVDIVVTILYTTGLFCK